MKDPINPSPDNSYSNSNYQNQLNNKVKNFTQALKQARLEAPDIAVYNSEPRISHACRISHLA